MDEEPKRGTKAPSIPAWIDCEDLLVKMREELLDRAIKLLNSEIEAGHIKVNGNALFSSESSSDVEQAMYLINNLVDDSGRLHQEYNEYVERSSSKRLDSKEAKKFEQLQKFVLFVEQITMLMDYARVLSAWADSASKLTHAHSRDEILKLTMPASEDRRNVLEFFVNNKDIGKEALTDEERETLSNVLKDEK
ncbi:MAG: hypothetical protein M1544_00220 [Candidatus Marsarchaeota archaeon]|nr:hypothetical protein [Candidatus Marsarchaeota archaeon]MCL5101772.1 hypothetical protein [Candidatus Marsarchaeota archaeon]